MTRRTIPIFVLRIEGKPGRAIRDLRHLLKRLLRQHHFRTIDVREDGVPAIVGILGS
jgi:hypothetical protein